MPNWCYTDFVFEGEKKQIETLYEFLDDSTSRKGLTNGFGNSWMGNIPYRLGLDYNFYQCRGTVANLELFDEGSIHLETETAWAPMTEVFDLVIKTLKLVSIKYAYRATEPGCELYQIHDPDSLGSYDDENVVIELYSITEETFAKYPFLTTFEFDMFWNEGALISYLEKHGIKGIDALEKIFKDISDNDDDEFAYVHVFEYV